MDLICQDDTKKWLIHFQNYLQTNQMQKTSHLLDYLLDCQIVFQSQPMKINGKLSENLTFLFDTYFKEDAVKPIILSNQILRQELYQQLSQAINDGSQYDRPLSSYSAILKMLKESNRDYKVWRGGVEQAYQRYLSERPRIVNDITAVLLTILWIFFLNNLLPMFKIITNLVTLSDRASIDQQVSKIFKYKIVSGRVWYHGVFQRK